MADGQVAKKFERQEPEARRRTLIEAAIRCLARDGIEGLSVRHICAEAGVSVGLINHHFPNKDALVAAVYRHMSAELGKALRAAVDAAPPEPRARLSAYIAASFSPPTLVPEVLDIWIVFWGMCRHTPEIARAHEETYAATIALLSELITEVAGAARPVGTLPDARLAAIGLNALLDGLWLEWCLNPRFFATEEGIRLAETYVDGLLART